MIFDYNYDDLLLQAEEIKRMLIASIVFVNIKV